MPDLSIFDLSGKTALVTGASRGIGRHLAESLARAGADIAITARDLNSLMETEAAITSMGQKAHLIQLDVTSVADCKKAIHETAHRINGIDILVNNAGVEDVRASLDVDEALWNNILDTNLKGAFFCAQAVALTMKDTKRPGSIINLCSLTSEVGIPTAVPYGSSKTGLLGMTRGLAAEWAPLGIRVNAIAPGYFRTAMTEVFYKNQHWQDNMKSKIPIGRFGNLDDLSGAAIFLASNASAYIAGQCLFVDGGYLASI